MQEAAGPVAARVEPATNRTDGVGTEIAIPTRMLKLAETHGAYAPGRGAPRRCIVVRDDELLRLFDEEARRLVWCTVWSDPLVGSSGAIYSFERVIGVGGTAMVALVRDQAGQIYAAKALSPHRFPVDWTRAGFRREGALLADLEHPNVMRMVDRATMGGTPVLVMEHLPGGSLYDRLAAERRPQLSLALRWIADSLRGLAAIHTRSLVHRDLSPRNLLLRATGELVVADFGTVRHLRDVAPSASTERIGSLLYIAPEQHQSPARAGPPADVYAVGQIAFQLLTGIAPLGNTGSAASHDPDIPRDISDLVEAMRSYAPSRRPADASVALRMLEATCEVPDRAVKIRST